MQQFRRGARIATAADAADDSGIDPRGLVDCALLFEASKSTSRSADMIGKGCFLGTPFKVTALRRTSRSGHPMLKLFFVPLKTP